MLTEWEKFRIAVFASPAMQRSLFAPATQSEFVDVLMRLGETYGYVFHADEIAGRLREAALVSHVEVF